MAALLTLVLLSPGSAFAQAFQQGSLARAAERGGRELAASAGPSSAPTTWTRVERLRPAEKIRVVAEGEVDRMVRYADLTPSDLVVIASDALPDKASDLLLDLVRNGQPYMPATASSGIIYKQLEVRLSGVFLDGTRVADLDRIILRIPRNAIIRVARPVRGSLGGAIGGAAGGFGLGFLAWLNLMMKPCGRSCGDEQFLAGAALGGLPIGGAVAGAMLVPHEPWKTIYER